MNESPTSPVASSSIIQEETTKSKQLAEVTDDINENDDLSKTIKHEHIPYIINTNSITASAKDETTAAEKNTLCLLQQAWYENIEGVKCYHLFMNHSTRH